MTVKEFLDGTNYFKKHNNIRARLFIKFLKKKKKAYLLLYAKFPSHKSCAEEYVYVLWLRQEMYDCNMLIFLLQSSWHEFLWKYLNEQRKYARLSHRLKTKKKLNGTAN